MERCRIKCLLTVISARYYVHLTPATDAQLTAISDEEEEVEEDEPRTISARYKGKGMAKNGNGRQPDSRESSAEPAAAKKTKLSNGSMSHTAKKAVKPEEEVVTEEDEPSTASDSDEPAGPPGKQVSSRHAVL